MLVFVAVGVSAMLAGCMGDAIVTALRAADDFCDRAERWVHEK